MLQLFKIVSAPGRGEGHHKKRFLFLFFWVAFLLNNVLGAQC